MSTIELSVQSNELTLSKINFTTIYQKRMLYAIVDSVSPYLKNVIAYNKKTSQGIHCNYEKGVFDIDRITYKAKDLEKNRQHYNSLRKAITDLEDKRFVITKLDGTVVSTRLILKSEWKPSTEVIRLSIDMELFQFLVDLRNGYTLFQMKTALSFSSIYTMKIYELLAKWRSKSKFYISIENLRFLTNTENKYKQIGEFKSRVLVPTKKQLDNDKLTDLKFDYRHVKEGRRVIGFDIYITKTVNSHEIKKEENNLSPHWLLSKAAIATFQEIGIQLKGKNLQLIKEFCTGKKEIEIKNYLSHLQDKAMDKEVKNFPGYVINAIKNELNDKPFVAGTTTRSQTNIIDELAKMKKV